MSEEQRARNQIINTEALAGNTGHAIILSGEAPARLSGAGHIGQSLNVVQQSESTDRNTQGDVPAQSANTLPAINGITARHVIIMNKATRQVERILIELTEEEKQSWKMLATQQTQRLNSSEQAAQDRIKETIKSCSEAHEWVTNGNGLQLSLEYADEVVEGIRLLQQHKST